MDDTAVPDDYLRISDAVITLSRGMFAGFSQPEPVHKIKLDFQKASVGFGAWKERASNYIWKAAADGHLPVYVSSSSITKPQLLPSAIVNRQMVVRGGLPDRAIRPSLKTVDGDRRLLGLLNTGVLVVRRTEFADWYQAERSKGQWPSQRTRKKPREGRPTKVTGALRALVMETLRRKKCPVAQLRRELTAAGCTDVPSVDTLERLVDQLHRETGRPELFRRKRRRHRAI